MNLADQHCQPLEGQPPMSDAQVQAHLADAPGWALKDGSIENVRVNLVGAMPAPIVVLDDRLRVMDCSVHWLKAHRFVERREVVGKTLQQLFPETPPDQMAEYEAALKGQTVKTRRTFTSPGTGAAVQFATVIAPWFAAERKVGGLTMAIGWSEIATVKGAAAAPAVMEGFDGGLLDMLKQVV